MTVEFMTGESFVATMDELSATHGANNVWVTCIRRSGHQVLERVTAGTGESQIERYICVDRTRSMQSPAS